MHHEFHIKLSKVEHKTKEPVSNFLSYDMAILVAAAAVVVVVAVAKWNIVNELFHLPDV
jgi:hypothetical protein